MYMRGFLSAQIFTRLPFKPPVYYSFSQIQIGDQLVMLNGEDLSNLNPKDCEFHFSYCDNICDSVCENTS